METSIPNDQPATPTTPKDIGRHQHEAQRAYSNSKLQAAKTAAHIYLMHRLCRSTDMKAWLAEQYVGFNAGIDRHNKEEAALRDRVAKFIANTLPPTDPLMIPVNTKADQDRQDADRQNLEGHAKLTDAEWKSRLQAKINVDATNASPFVPIVRYALDLRYREDASTAARIAKALEYLETEFGKVVVHSPDDLWNAIGDAGGFEKVVAMARGNTNNDENSDDVGEAVKTTLVNKLRGAVVQATPKGQIPVATSLPAGLVAAIGRLEGGNLSVISILDLPADKIDQLLLELEDETLIPPNTTTLFFSRLANLGQLVRVGEESSFRENNLASGRKVRTCRVLSSLPREKSAEWLVSAQYADSSIVVCAEASADLDLKSTSTAVLLGADDTAKFLGTLSPFSSAGTFEVEVADVGGIMRAQVILPGEPAKTEVSVDFGPMSAAASKPLDTKTFECAETAEVSIGDLSEFYRSALADWKGKKTDKQSSKVAMITFTGTEMRYSVEGSDDVEMPYDGGSGGTHSVSVRAKDLHDVVDAILHIHEPTRTSISIECDTGGLIRFSWSDPIGRFRIDLPLATANGSLSNRRVEPITL